MRMRMAWWLGALLLAMVRPVLANETVTYYLTDAQGTVLMTEDANGATTATYDYRPYGASEGVPAPTGPGYTGHVNDPGTGLVYMQQRYYDPMIGRFLSVDPMAVDTATAWNFNRYDYAANNPYKFKDPDGRAIDTVIDAGFIIYDTGRFLGAAAAWAHGELSGNAALAAVGREGMVSTGRDLGASAVSVAVPGLAAPVARGALKGADAVADANRAASRAGGVPDSMLGPSGLPRRHTATHNTRKAAREASEQRAPRDGGTRNDANPSDVRQGPHFQAEDAKGRNVHPVVHDEYPKRFK